MYIYDLTGGYGDYSGDDDSDHDDLHELLYEKMNFGEYCSIVLMKL